MPEARTTPPRRLRVLVVDDSEICRSSIISILQADGDIEVVGEGEDGFSAFALVDSLAPDLVTMDVQMPGKNGLEAVEQIMARHPVPILVVTAEPLHDQAGVASTAIQNGALDVVSKPSITDVAAGEALRALVRHLATIPVFRHADPRNLTAMPPMGASIELLAIASGKGGIASVIGLLSRLPVGLAVPVVLYEPMPPEVVVPYSTHVARICKLPIRIATAKTVICPPGELTLIPGSRATWTGHGTLRLDEGPASALQFFSTLALVYGGRAAGVVLRGESSGGAEGLSALRDAGGKTFIERPPPSNDSSDPAAPEGTSELGQIAASVLQLTK